ncbi:MAG TPA: lysine--tRNA ligase [Candidatus Binataceae bacterium]|nr:lysine--tRNA ligase [Candidatus Binataceae bacterium]
MPEHTAASGELWPFEEARRLLSRVADYSPSRKVIFESGFGPSGLPHLGTLGEVLRPSYVRQALRELAPQHASELVVFIDDLDGLRKVPETLPAPDRITPYLGHPVSRIPDPFGDCHPSFSEHMIGLLGQFLAPVAVDYRLMRSSEAYRAGRFDPALRQIMRHHEQIIAIVAPTLREGNRQQWSPFLPLCPRCGQINSTVVTAYHPDAAAVEFVCERAFGGAHGCGYSGKQSVLGGGAKVQWKVDWALRWYALGVDYELYGKDLIDSARVSGQIVGLLGGQPPLGFAYEMFLDEQGHKVSKSVGRGVGVDRWQRYAPIEVLKYFLMLNPRRARKLFVEAIPQFVDDYLALLRAWSNADRAQRIQSPLWFILDPEGRDGFDSELSFGLIMNLVSALGSDDRQLIRNYLNNYDPAWSKLESPMARGQRDAKTSALLDRLVDCALNYYRDFVEPTKQRYVASPAERAQLLVLLEFLQHQPEASADEIEKQIYDVGRRYYDKPGKIFPLLYKTLLGQSQGPRLGVFIKLVTPARIAAMLEAALA